MAKYSAIATADAWMNGSSGNQDDNHGGDIAVELGALVIGGDKAKLARAIANFDLSALAGRTINAAELRRRIGGSSDGLNAWNAKISRCTRPADWVEAEVTWNDYRVSTPWTSAGGDFDDAGPPVAITYTEPASPSAWEVVPGLKDFITDALDNHNGIVSFIIRATNESPPDTDWVSWGNRAELPHMARWRLVVDHSGPPIGMHGERGFVRGAQRGVMRGGL